MQNFMALLVGLSFGVGLIISGMTDPSKVIGFLDVTGLWDPSLAFVMGSAVVVSWIGVRFARARKVALLGCEIRWPTLRRIDVRLIIGGLLFGTGWGLAGYCPGPALASLATGNSQPIIFSAAMLIGMAIFEGLEHLSLFKTAKIS